jgi:hypothetical protein
MPKPAALHALRRKQGNSTVSMHPNWATGLPVIVRPSRPTEFEMQVRKLGLTPKKYASSVELRRWCERNKNHHYIPEWLLKAWNITIDTNVGPAS